MEDEAAPQRHIEPGDRDRGHENHVLHAYDPERERFSDLVQDPRHAELGSPGRFSIEDHRRPRQRAVRDRKVEGAVRGFESRVRDFMIPEDVDRDRVGLLVYGEPDDVVRVA